MWIIDKPLVLPCRFAPTFGRNCFAEMRTVEHSQLWLSTIQPLIERSATFMKTFHGRAPGEEMPAVRLTIVPSRKSESLDPRDDWTGAALRRTEGDVHAEFSRPAQHTPIQSQQCTS